MHGESFQSRKSNKKKSHVAHKHFRYRAPVREQFCYHCIVRLAAVTKSQRHPLAGCRLACKQPCQWVWKYTVLFTFIHTNTKTEVCAAALYTGRPHKRISLIDESDLKRVFSFHRGNTYMCCQKAPYRQVCRTLMGVCLSDRSACLSQWHCGWKIAPLLFKRPTSKIHACCAEDFFHD